VHRAAAGASSSRVLHTIRFDIAIAIAIASGAPAGWPDPGDYVTCIVGGRHELLGVDDAALRRASGPELCDLMLRFVAGWPDATQAIVRAVDPQSAFAIDMGQAPLPPGALSHLESRS